MGALSGLRYTRAQLERATAALFALDWSPWITTTLGPQRMTRLFTRLKIPKLPKLDYAKLLQLINLPPADQSGIFPLSLESRRALLVRLDLEQIATFPDWLTTIHQLQQLLVETPEQLALFSFQEANRLAEQVSPDIPLLRLWQAACVSAGAGSGIRLYRAPNKCFITGPINSGVQHRQYWHCSPAQTGPRRAGCPGELRKTRTCGQG